MEILHSVCCVISERTTVVYMQKCVKFTFQGKLLQVFAKIIIFKNYNVTTILVNSMELDQAMQ